jgi:IS5 family transposase
MAKGGAHKQYEFGTKAGIVRGKDDNVILGAKSFEENIHDGHTPEAALEQAERVAHHRSAAGITARGRRGSAHCGATQLAMPAKPKADATEHEKRKAGKRFRRRAGIEPVIGHLKSDFRLVVHAMKFFVFGHRAKPEPGHRGHRGHRGQTGFEIFVLL